jgi:hypothetical protein
MSSIQRVGVVALPVLLIAALVVAQTPSRRAAVSKFDPNQPVPPTAPPAAPPPAPAGPIAGPAGPAAAGRYQAIIGNHVCLVDTTSGAIWEYYTQANIGFGGFKHGWASVAPALDTSVPGTPNRFQGFTTGSGDGLAYNVVDTTNGRTWTYTKGTKTTGTFPHSQTETFMYWAAGCVAIEESRK